MWVAMAVAFGAGALWNGMRDEPRALDENEEKYL